MPEGWEDRYDNEHLMELREDFLIDNRPTYYERLVDEGRLEEHLEQMAERCRTEARRLVSQGITFTGQAWQWAIRSVLLETEWD